MVAIGASPDEPIGVRHRAPRGEWTSSPPAPGLCTSFTWAPMAQLSRSRTTRRTFAVACALTRKGAGVLNCERLLPEIEAAEAMLSRFEVFKQIAAGEGGTAATPERDRMLVLQAIAPADDLKSALDRLESDLAAVRRRALNA